MQSETVRPYLARVKEWKVKNMVRNYLQARTAFKDCQRKMRKGMVLSVENLKEIGGMLFEVKEDHHLLYKRLEDPHKNKFETAQKYLPTQIEIDFINNVGLLFHKMLVARELKYVMEHYVEESETFQRNKENLDINLHKIDGLFDEGIEIVKSFILHNSDNILLLTLLLDDTENTKKHFGQNAVQIIEQFGNGKGLADIYYQVGKYYLTCGRKEHARKMFKSALKKNSAHKKSMVYLRKL